MPKNFRKKNRIHRSVHPKMSEQKKMHLQIILILAAIFFLILGICRNEAAIVWNKAVNICMECIGLG